jgi:predicted  nucleic acid-binding Zn-ribbon protein
MNAEVNKLHALQLLDLEAKRLREEIAALPKAVAGLETRAKALVGQRAVVIDLLAKEEVLRRRQESDVKDLEGKLAKLRPQLDNAADAKQVTAFEHQIAFAKGEIAKLEDAELESMERTEQLDTQKRVADQAVEAAWATHERERLRALTTVAADRTALDLVEADRATQRALIDEDLLSTYDRLLRGKGSAVAEAWLQKCTACQMMLRPQRWNDLRDRDNHDLMTCESCGRILWYDPARDAPQRKPVEFESIAAQIVRGL